ncbi:MAG TPA: alkaline phosphatase family protein [Reyranella sp.]
MSWTGINWTSEYPRFVADVTGDGPADLIGCGLDGVWVSRNDGHGNFMPPERGLANLGFGQSWRVERHVRTMGQFGGAPRIVGNAPLHATVAATTAARAPGGTVITNAGPGNVVLPRSVPGADVAGFGDDGIWIALSHGDGQFGPAALVLQNLGFNQGWRIDRHPRVLADLNGDGLSDIVGFGDAGVWTVLCAGQPSSDKASIGPLKFVLANFGYSQGWRVAQHPRLLADLTGDKRADIVGFGNDGMWVALGRGDGGFADAKLAINDFGFNQGWRTDVHERLTGDLTGDGKVDLVAFGNDGVWTALSRGDGSFTPAKLVVANFGANQGWRTSQHPRFVADLRGNRHADLIGFGNDGVWTALGNGDGTFAAPRFVLANFGVNQGWTVANHPRFLADTTGDGRPDIVGFGNDGVWVALNKGDGTFGDARFVLADFGFKSGQTGIKHVFVLMMENRSYDHFLGFSNITGTDAHSGQMTQAEGLKGNESDVYESVTSTVSQTAGDVIAQGPPHQFNDVLIDLCGPEFDNVQLNGGSYPAVKGNGYAAAYGIVTDKTRSGEVMRCFAKNNLRVLNALATEFVVCDHWFSSMAGPTEPNRMFVHAATSGPWDDSPSEWQQIKAVLFGDDIKFSSGTIYDRLRRANVPFRIYAGDDFPNVALLHGVSVYTDIDDFEDFEGDINDDDFDAAYTFIEPDYDVVNFQSPGSFSGGNSQHPSGSVLAGERLIKQVYEIIRKSPRWNQSMLVVTWDEHGGFYDHVLPPRADPTGARGQAHGYMFDQLGPRVPAVVISPLCPKNMIEHRTLEHSVVPATVEQMFGLDPMTVRDGRIIGLQTLATLKSPRQDTPIKLPDPVAAPAPAVAMMAARRDPSMPLSAIHDSQLFWTLRVAVKQHLEAAPGDSAKIKARVLAMNTLGDLNQYLSDATASIKGKQVQARKQRVTVRKARVAARL